MHGATLLLLFKEMGGTLTGAVADRKDTTYLTIHGTDDTPLVLHGTNTRVIPLEGPDNTPFVLER